MHHFISGTWSFNTFNKEKQAKTNGQQPRRQIDPCFLLLLFSHFESVGKVGYRLRDPSFTRVCLCSVNIFEPLLSAATALFSSLILGLLFFWPSPHCVEISSPRILCIYFRSFVLHGTLKCSGLDVKELRLLFFNNCSFSCYSSLTGFHISTHSETPGEQERLMSRHKNGHIGADCRDDFKTCLSQLMIR